VFTARPGTRSARMAPAITERAALPVHKVITFGIRKTLGAKVSATAVTSHHDPRT
jgi:hypothetical protein